jgi:hypothetical protein
MSIKSNSNGLHEAKDTPVFAYVTADITTLTGGAETTSATPPTISEEQRIERMYELADILASIFEALPDEHEHAIAVAPKAA